MSQNMLKYICQNMDRENNDSIHIKICQNDIPICINTSTSYNIRKMIQC